MRKMMMGVWGVLGVGMFTAIGAPAAAQGHTAEVIEVPLRVESGRLVVSVQTADGGELDFILTTGNTATVLTESTAARLGERPKLALGDAIVDTDELYTIPDAQLEIEGKQFHGMVASNTLNQFDVLVDAPGGRLLLKSIGPRVEWPGTQLSEAIRLRVFHGMVLALDLTVDGHDFGAMLDLGSSKVLANAAAGAKLGIEEDGIATIRVGDTTLADAPLSISDMEVFDRFDPNGAGFLLVGASLAYDCAVSISWVHQEMRMCAR